MSNITIFTAPKAFSDPHINIIQRNAIQSWKELGSRVEVLLIGDEDGMKDASVELDVRQLPDVTRNELGTPLVSSIFSLAREATSADILIYLNADNILLPECLDVIDLISNQYDEFLIVGKRWNLDLTSEIAFNANWANELKSRAVAQGKIQGPTAMDYFVFPKHLYQDIPPFAIGRAGWDNWMIYHGMQQPWQVIDATPAMMVIHQNHDYSHLPGGKPHFDLDESNQNVELAGGYTKSFDLLDVRQELREGKIRRIKLTLPIVLRILERFVNPQLMEGWRWELTRKIRKLRRRIS